MRKRVGFGIAGLAAVCLGAGFAGSRAAGQVTGGPSGPIAAKAVDEFAGEPLVMERLATVYRYAADGTETKEITGVLRLQSEAAARQYGVLNVPFAGSNERVEIDYVRVRKANGTVVETPGTEAIDMPQEVTRQAPFYSDLKMKQIPIRSLAMGDELEYRVRTVQTKAETPGQFWGQEGFGSGMVILDESIELRVPKDKYVQVWSPKNAPVVTEAGGEKVYRWTGSLKTPTVGPGAEAAKKAAPPAAEEGELAPVEWTTFRSWAEVGAWYRALEGDRAVPDAEVKAKTAEVTAGKTTEEQKREAIYTYVATQVRYIGVAFGIGRFQPHAAAEILRNQYGDCKDKHTLLAAMLAAAGVKADAALIGAGIPMNEEVPTPAAFNHLITAIPEGGETVWLDSTAEVMPYGALEYPVRDKRALLIPDEGAAKVERTPARLPFASRESFVATAVLDKDGTVTSHMELTMRGDDEVGFRAGLRQVSPGQWDQFMQLVSQQIGFSGTTSHVEFSGQNTTAEPLKVSYDYKREKLGDWDNFRIVPLFPAMMLPAVDEKDPPKQAIVLGEPKVETATTVMTLPAGWFATLPDAVHLKTDYMTFDKTYTLSATDGKLTVERRFEVLKSRFPAAEWKKYKTFADKAVNDGEPWIQLTSTGSRAGEKAPPKAEANDAEAGKLVQEANEAIQRGESNRAAELLDKAEKVNPNQSLLWATRGYLEFSRQNWAAAASDYQKEIDAAPDTIWVYGALAQTQANLHRMAEAEQTARKLVKLTPDDEKATGMLGALELENGEYGEAVKLLEPIAAKHPENVGMQLAVASAEVKAGKGAEAAPMLLKLLGETNPAVMNDAAYQLAGAGLHLDLAEAASRKVVEQETKATEDWTIDSEVQANRGTAQALVSSWDTLGWVLHLEKKDEAAAESYVRAAWMNRPTAEVGLHLGQILEAEGKRQEALTTFELAEACEGEGVAKVGARAENLMELKKRASELRAQGVTNPVRDSHVRLQEMRRFPLGKGSAGVSEYKVLVSGGKVVGARPDVSVEGRKGDAMMLNMELAGWMPEGSGAKLLRKGVLNCHGGGCEFVVIPF